MDGIERALGRLEASIEALTKSDETGREESRESRARIYKEIETTNRTVTELKAEMREVNDRLKLAETQLSSFDRIRENIKGGAIVLSIIWASIGATVAVFWKAIVAKFLGPQG